MLEMLCCSIEMEAHVPSQAPAEPIHHRKRGNHLAVSMGYQMDALGHDLNNGFPDHDLHDDVFAPADVAMRSPGVAEHVSGHLTAIA